jgi:hypothetical protein
MSPRGGGNYKFQPSPLEIGFSHSPQVRANCAGRKLHPYSVLGYKQSCVLTTNLSLFKSPWYDYNALLNKMLDSGMTRILLVLRGRLGQVAGYPKRYISWKVKDELWAPWDGSFAPGRFAPPGRYRLAVRT